MQKYPSEPILIADDEPHIRLGLSISLKSAGFTNLVECGNGLEVLPLTIKHKVEIILLDLNMPGKSGEELIQEIKQQFPEAVIIVITARNDVSTAVECMKNGASDYLLKPLEKNRLLTCVRRCVEICELRKENSLMRHYFLEEDRKETPEALRSIITRNTKMKAIFQYCEAVAGSSQPVLITGETGVGKELFAKALHQLSGRSGKFVAVNTAGLDSNMFSDTLFGHIKGAFTGANGSRGGMIENASGGTLFLDEIGDMNIENQVKLLRLLQEREYMPLGADTVKLSDARIIVATNCNLEAMQKDGSFRKDLFYRLKTHHMHIPPLRERQDDIEPLLEQFMNEAASEMKKKRPSYPPELISHLKTYDFPGNIRELRSMVFDALSGHGSPTLPMKSFISKINAGKPSQRETSSNTQFQEKTSYPEILPTLKESAQILVKEALKRANGNQRIASGMLGISQQALSKRLKNITED